jgi:hypothetical protein
MKDQTPKEAPGQKRVLATLVELIDALDRRVPQVERVGEVGIALEAAALRQAAMTRIEQLKGAESNRKLPFAEKANAVMSDDGGAMHDDE